MLYRIVNKGLYNLGVFSSVERNYSGKHVNYLVFYALATDTFIEHKVIYLEGYFLTNTFSALVLV